MEYYNNDVYAYFGYYTGDQSCIRRTYTSMCDNSSSRIKIEKFHRDHNVVKDNTTLAILINLSTCLGYIPGISILTGFLKVYIKKKFGILRGILEILCIGVLLIPYDMYITYKRNRSPVTLEDLLAMIEE
jgi:hypothetical protein